MYWHTAAAVVVTSVLCIQTFTATTQAVELSRDGRQICEAGYSKCPNDDRCIWNSDFCDGFRHCSDGSDEDKVICATRPCAENMLVCDSLQCIPKDLFCAGHMMCGDGSIKHADVSCPDVTCEESFTKCRHMTKCVRDIYLCDGYPDCEDGSDEDHTFCNTRTCPENHLQCDSGKCVDRNAFCRGDQWCRDMSVRPEPLNCPNVTCTEGYTKCPFLSKCVRDEYFCNGWSICMDGSDEDPSFCATRTCPEGAVRCASGQCINKNDFCQGTSRCNDNSIRAADVICPDVTCTEETSRCPLMSKCILDYELCNYARDCTDGLDENRALCDARTCPENHVRCESGQCVDRDMLCRSELWCFDSSVRPEHLDCPKVTCKEGYTKCRYLSKCVKDKYLCDGSNDCMDGSDEDPSFCGSRVCRDDELRCASGQCIRRDDFCSGRAWCKDRSFRRQHGVCPAVTCQQGFTKCPFFSKCILDEHFCDIFSDCPDNSDEDRDVCNSRQCPHGAVRCKTGQCIDKDDFCEGRLYCKDNSRSRQNICENSDNNDYTLRDEQWAACTSHRLIVNDCIPLRIRQIGPGALERILRELRTNHLSVSCRVLFEMKKCAIEKMKECREFIEEPSVKMLQMSIDAVADAIDYVCSSQHVDVVEQHKLCFLGGNDAGSILRYALRMACPNLNLEDIFYQLKICSDIAYNPTGPRDTPPPDITCPSEVIQNVCGSEIAGHLKELAAKVFTDFGCQTADVKRSDRRSSVFQRYLHLYRTHH